MRLPRKKRKPRVEMLPLMDVVFLLLVFFIYSMMAMAVHRGMPLRLPVSVTAEREMVTVLALTVQADGSLFLDKEPVILENLSDILKQRQAAMDDADAVTLQIFAEDTLSYQDLYRVLDAVKTAGLEKISLQARREAAP
jgi:Biopolymer transport protein